MKDSIHFTAFVLSLAFVSQPIFAQKLVDVHHNGVDSLFPTLPDAYNAAVNRDPLYIPGGTSMH